MAYYENRRWEPSYGAPARRDQRGGPCRAYVPDPLVGRLLAVDAELDAQCARVEAAVRSLADGPGASGLEGLARFPLRSEALASSRIEGLQVSPQELALVELAEAQGLPARSFSANAQLVGNNISALRRTARELASAPRITTPGITDLHRALLPVHDPSGLRTMQNRVGGSDRHPLDAEFVPPPAEHVTPLMDDLATYASGAGHAPLAQAGLVHAQFKTIHPFGDGNGRIGRALIHTVLSRRGPTRAAVLPVSLVLLTRSETYIRGLTAYRYQGPPDGDAAREGVKAWLTGFLDAVEIAVGQASTFARDLADIQRDWADRYACHRQAQGRQRQARAGSAVAHLLRQLPEIPLVTARTMECMLGSPSLQLGLRPKTWPRSACSPRQVERNTTGFLAREVFDLLTFTEQRLSSTRWDTRDAQPRQAVPALPQP